MKRILWLVGGCVLILVLSSMFVDSSNILLYRIYGAIICFLVVFIAWGIMAYYLLKPEPKVKNENIGYRYKELSLEEISKYGIDIDELKKIIYHKFKDIHKALSDMDMKVLKKHLTDDLYKDYVIELSDLKKENKKIINKDIELVNIKIYNIEKIYGVLHIDVYLNVRMVDVIVNIDDSVNNYDKIDFEYELNFIKKLDVEVYNSDYLLSKKSCVNRMEIKDVTGSK
jgi:hypothetical protein